MLTPAEVGRFARRLTFGNDLKNLKAEYFAVEKRPDADEIFRVVGQRLGPEKYKILLTNVAAVWVEHHEEECMSHPHPLLTEYQAQVVKFPVESQVVEAAPTIQRFRSVQSESPAGEKSRPASRGGIKK